VFVGSFEPSPGYGIIFDAFDHPTHFPFSGGGVSSHTSDLLAEAMVEDPSLASGIILG